MGRRTTATEIRRTQWLAFEWFAEHQLLGEEYWDSGRGARWVIGQPGTFVHKCEIIAGIGGSLIVHGDFDVCRFAHYGDHADAWSRLLWMADCPDVSYYVAQKASIGMRGQFDVWTYDDAVARDDILDVIKERRACGASREELRVLIEAAREYTETHETLYGFLHHEGHKWDLWEYSFGQTLRPHIVISHLALNKCAALLSERHGDAGPPACRKSPAPGARLQEAFDRVQQVAQEVRELDGVAVVCPWHGAPTGEVTPCCIRAAIGTVPCPALDRLTDRGCLLPSGHSGEHRYC